MEKVAPKTLLFGMSWLFVCLFLRLVQFDATALISPPDSLSVTLLVYAPPWLYCSSADRVLIDLMCILFWLFAPSTEDVFALTSLYSA